MKNTSMQPKTLLLYLILHDFKADGGYVVVIKLFTSDMLTLAPILGC